MKNVLIVGANFQNKGAQSMLFTTTSEIKKINIDCNIYFATTCRYDHEKDYYFKSVLYNKPARQIALGNKTLYNILGAAAKDFARFMLRKKNSYLWSFMDLKNILPDIDLIIDISGFSLGEKWPATTQERYLDGIRLARKYKIPIILMPQSFGPFNYDKDKSYLIKEISELLKYPDIIFAREQAGFNELTSRFQLKNLQISTDLVLQSNGVKTELIFKKVHMNKLPTVIGNAKVAIIPNVQCFKHGDKQTVLNCYKVIMNEVLSGGKEIYIFRHSVDDWEPCQLIYEMFQENEHVHILNNDFSCLEYDEFIKNFEFIICSRFHGVVHAYRNAVPAIILGWAVKYSELAAQLSQSKYVFNIVDEKIDYNELKLVTSQMLENWKKESDAIKEKIVEIQKDSCFYFLKRY